jgi:mycofactocin system glycosyltransferase
MRYALDPSVRRRSGGLVLLGGSPLRLFRLRPGGARLVDAVERGEDVGPESGDGSGTAGTPTQRLLDRLVDAGVLHPRPGPPQRSAADVTVVVPVLGDDPERWRELVAGLGDVGRVLLVDDASDPPVAPVEGAEVVRRAVNGGPGAARNTGLSRVTSPLVAFVDADTTTRPGWLDPLLALLDDPRVGLAAPRVVTPNGGGALARFDAVRGPLDLGDGPARVRAGTRVSYVPAAAVVAAVDALQAVGGFDEALRVGEDVDLVWRLDEARWACRYEPAVTVEHAVRPSLTSWWRQRVAYGRSAAPLARRHPGALAPVVVSGWSAGSWALVALGQPVAGVALAGATVGLLARRLRQLERPVPLAARLAGLGTLAAGRQLAAAMTRTWWPLAALAALVSRRARLVVAAAIVLPALDDWRRLRPALDPVRFTVLRLLDDVAYGTGVWLGVLAERDMAPLVPDLTSWPAPTRAEAARLRRRATPDADHAGPARATNP